MATILSEAQHRLFEKLYFDVGEEVKALLMDDAINEIMLNPDGSLWADSVTKGQHMISHWEKAHGLAVIYGVAGIHQLVVNHASPMLEAELPFYKIFQGERFTAQISPIVSGPSFTIRKKSQQIFSLHDYLTSNRMTNLQMTTLQELVAARKNILVCGGPGSGKTTVTNALIKEAVLSDPNQRFVILEDLPELQCRAENSVAMLTSRDVSMTQLLRAAMRMRPDRILVGEVRGREALDLLKAWNTGCPGGMGTVHANGAIDAIQRITDLAMEAGLTLPPLSLIAQTIDAIVSVTRRGNQKGFIQEILTIGGCQNGQITFKTLA